MKQVKASRDTKTDRSVLRQSETHITVTMAETSIGKAPSSRWAAGITIPLIEMLSAVGINAARLRAATYPTMKAIRISAAAKP